MNTVNAFLDKYGRFGLDAATATSTVGFAAAKATTKLGVRQLPIVFRTHPRLTSGPFVVQRHPQSSIDGSRCRGLSPRPRSRRRTWCQHRPQSRHLRYPRSCRAARPCPHLRWGEPHVCVPYRSLQLYRCPFFTFSRQPRNVFLHSVFRQSHA